MGRKRRAPVGRLTGFEYGVLERPDPCLWTADKRAMRKAAKRLRWLEAERTRADATSTKEDG